MLYELFTGRWAVTPGKLPEVVRRHVSGDITPPSEFVRSMHPAVERAIMRCLDRRPHRRPASALAVSALLPGGDLFGDALFAGETPSPEMVAAAGDVDPTLSARAGVLLVAAFLSLFALGGWMFDRSTVAGQTGMRKPAPVLAEYGRQRRALAGTATPAAHEAILKRSRTNRRSARLHPSPIRSSRGTGLRRCGRPNSCASTLPRSTGGRCRSWSPDPGPRGRHRRRAPPRTLPRSCRRRFPSCWCSPPSGSP